MNRSGMMRDSLLWLADQGVEGHIFISLGSLRLAAPSLWRNSIKIVVDCGLSPAALEFLMPLRREQVHVIPVSSVSNEPPDTRAGIVAMRTRIHVSSFLERLQRAGDVPRATLCLVCDADTVFLREFVIPEPRVVSDLSVMPEWDNRDGVERPLLLLRQSTFTLPLTEVHVSELSAALEIQENTLRNLPTYNTGVFSFALGTQFVDAWRREYDRINTIRNAAGQLLFSPYEIGRASRRE